MESGHRKLEFIEEGSSEDFIEVLHRRCLQMPKELRDLAKSSWG